jgi:D-alanyl-D-alanine carboxypeptidase/D-alanyl-D-alanine-endopeptidase (penicillin-binding protein 4)
MTRWRGRVRTAPAILTLLCAAACGGVQPAVTPGPRPTRQVVELRRAVDAILAAPELARATWGVAVRSLARDETLYAHNPQKLLLPASNVKLITLAAAAERLGWAFTFDTDLVAVGPVDGGVLYGDLVVVGRGDPSIDDWDGQATRLFAEWAGQLKAAGIHTVTGSIVGDDNRIPDRWLGPGWAWDDLDRSFATPLGALQFNQNTARLAVAPADQPGDPAIIGVAPYGSGLTLRNRVMTTAAGTPAMIQTRRPAGDVGLEVSGAIGVGAPAVVRNVSAANPTAYFVTALREALVAAGIDVRGPACDVDDLATPPPLDKGTVVLTHHSAPLSALAVTMMKVSQNLFAESVLHAAGGVEAVRAALAGWGLAASDVAVVDGSGLSRYNLATSDALTEVLIRVYRSQDSRELFLGTLPVAGRDGTLAARMIGTPAEGRVRAKTGAFSNARALSGYVDSADGEPLVFSILANNFGTSPDVIDAATDAIVVRLAQFSRR